MENKVEYNCYPTINNNEIETFQNMTGQIYFPDVPQVMQANQRFLSNMIGIDNNMISDRLPVETGPTNNPQPVKVEMPQIKPNSLPRPVTIALPDGVSPNAPILLLSSLPEETTEQVVMAVSPSNTPNNNLDSNLKKVNEISAKSGLPPVPVVGAPTGQAVIDQVNTAGLIPAEQDNRVPATRMLLADSDVREARIVELPPASEKAPQNISIRKTHKRRYMKKLLMYIAIALVIYLVYLLFNEK